MSVSSNSLGKSKVSMEVDASNIQTKGRRSNKATAKETSEEVEESTNQTTKKKTIKKIQKRNRKRFNESRHFQRIRHFRHTQSTHCPYNEWIRSNSKRSKRDERNKQ